MRVLSDRSMRPTGLGDIVADVQALAALAAASRTPGGVGGWLSAKYAQFSKLPTDVANLSAQLNRVRPILEANGADVTPLMDAESELAQLTARLPGTRDNVTRVMNALGPILPQLQAGQYGTDVLATLASSSVDLVATLDDINTLIGLRDDAQRKIQSAVTNPSLSPSVATQAAKALTGAIDAGQLVKIGLLAAGAFVFVRVLQRNR